ncbi:MAG: DNA polymerase I [Flavobacteriales bacterium]|nr:DNA polymerase I [Flavobacteriales bacterium]MCB9449406.1 DNA polymerase I [Flavobacteriales bacterium]
MKKLFLLDAMALIYRAYFAFSKNPRVNSRGMNTSASFGFTTTLLDLLQKEKPTHIAIAFDTAAPTTRHEDFTAYKANREAMPEDIGNALPWIEKIAEGFRIPVLKADGYEADDIIGTLARRAEKEGFDVYMVTPDKDFAQLVTDKIHIYKPARFGNGAEIWGIPEVLKNFGVKEPLQVIDILGLWGDQVDNIPGIPGVGEKTAKDLIGKYDSIENLISHAGELKGKLKERVETHADQALMSKKLATIITDVPVPFDPEDLQLEAPDEEQLTQVFAELEFRNLAKRVFGKELQVTAGKAPESQSHQPGLFDAEGEPEPAALVQLKTIDTESHRYTLVESEEAISNLAKELSVLPTFCFDTETTGLDTLTAQLVGMSFSWKPGEAYYVPVQADRAAAEQRVNVFKEVLENNAIGKTGQNLKYDISILRGYGITVRGPLFDTMIAHYLIQPDQRHNMDFLSETYLQYRPISITTLIGEKGKHQKNMQDVEPALVSDYACEDADITLQLRGKFEPMLKDEGTEKLFWEVETPLVPVLASMESEGIRVDPEVLVNLGKELKEDILNMQDKIYETAGGSFNISSPKQVGEVLFDRMGITPKPKKTKSGQYSTNEEVLAKLASENPVVEQILTYRELQKLKNTYVDPLPSMIHPRTGRIHTSFNQVVAATGRLSSDNPNLQNIPIRTERGREIRKAFVARDENFCLLSADYSQIELRIFAELSGDEAMTEAFREGRDIHAATAARVFEVTQEEVTSEMRRKAKMVNFGIIYGISAFGLAQRLNIPRKEAAAIIEQYFAKYPRIKSYMDDTIEFARKNGYVQTMLGRRRYLKDILSGNAVVRGFAERNAINAPVQGSAADMIKVAMIAIHHDLQQKNLRSKMILQVHDELIFDANLEEIESLREIVRSRMQNALPMNIPVVVEMGEGRNWLEAH